jgi:hypothetical protein
MSDSPSNFSFPHRTPVFTAVIVLVCFAAFGWLATKYYTPRAAIVDKIQDVKGPTERKALLVEHKAKEKFEGASYGWIDQKAGVVRLPIDRAIELVVHDYSTKPPSR